jgi:hypothetical protein
MHRVAAVAIWMSLVLASLLAFQVFISVDEMRPAGTRSACTVTQVDSPTKQDALDAIQAAADDVGRDIFKVQPDATNSTRSRTLFAFATGPSTSPSTLRPFAGQTMATRVRPAADITTEDLRGRYVTDAEPAEMGRLLAVLEQAGLTAQNDSLSGLRGTLLIAAMAIGRGNLAGALVVTAAALWLAIAYSVSRNRKIYAIRALHGFRRGANLRAELTGATTTFCIGLAGLAVVGLPTLGVLTRFTQFPTFLQVLAVTVGILYAWVILLAALAVATLPSASIPAVLKGEQVPVRTAVLASATQVLVLAIVFATTSAAMTRIDAVSGSIDATRHWTQGDPLYALRVSVSATGHMDGQKAAAPGLAATIATMEAAGQVLLAHYEGSNQPDETTGTPSADQTFTPLIVNDAYLDRQVVNDADGHRLTHLAAPGDTFTLLVPTTYRGDREALLATYAENFEFTCSLDLGDDVCDPRGTIIDTAPSQDLFLFNGTQFMPAEAQQDAATLHDPVVAVVPASSKLISPLYAVSIASQDNLFFTDPVALRTGLEAHGAMVTFQGIDNAADAVTAAVAISRSELRMDAFSLALGWGVLVLSSIVMVTVYCDRRKRPMFVQLIHGFGFTERHLTYLAGVIILSAVGIAVTAATATGLTGGRELAIALGSIGAQLAVALVAIRTYEALFRADFIKRS